MYYAGWCINDFADRRLRLGTADNPRDVCERARPGRAHHDPRGWAEEGREDRSGYCERAVERAVRPLSRRKPPTSAHTSGVTVLSAPNRCRYLSLIIALNDIGPGDGATCFIQGCSQ
jgi:hypothetical protein